MRITGGKLRGRVLNPPLKKWPTRPTTDIAREALYNILTNRVSFDTMIMLDLFGGTGAHVLECISRGCQDATYVDAHFNCHKWFKEQVKLFEVTDYVKLYRMDVARYLKTCDVQYNYIFADPPYNLTNIRDLPQLVLDHQLLSTDGLFIMEHGSDVDFDDNEACYESRKYGQSRFSFFR